MPKQTPPKAFFLSPGKARAGGLKIGRSSRTGSFEKISAGSALTNKDAAHGKDVKTYRSGGQKFSVNAARETAPAQERAPLEIVATHPPVHPGEILREEFMEPMKLTAYAVAKACKIPRSKLERIVREDLGISGDTAVRLGRFFGNSPQFWMNLQASYEVMKAGQELGDAVNEIEPYQHNAA